MTDRFQSPILRGELIRETATHHKWPPPADIKLCIEAAIYERMQDQTIAAQSAAIEAVSAGIKNAIRRYEEEKYREA